jgi:hypothetical protein
MKIDLNLFGGMYPKKAPHLLEFFEAQEAIDCDLRSGDLRPIKEDYEVATLSGESVLTIYKFKANGTEYLFESDKDIDLAPSPVAQDAFERIYYAGDDEPRVIANDLISTPYDPDTDFYKLGVPAPTAALEIGSGYATGNRYTAYVYSYMTAYGEIGPPSPVDSISDYASGTVPLSGILDPETGRRITKVRIFRTDSAVAGLASFRKVCDAQFFSAALDFAVGDYAIYGETLYKCTTVHPAGAWDASHFTAGDDILDTNLSTTTLDSELNYPPDPDLRGLVILPNGIAAGFVENTNTVWVTKAYLPHAWAYAYAIKDKIIGLASRGTSLVVMTDARVSLFYGTDPSRLTNTDYAGIYPCRSKRGISDDAGVVVFPSTEGMVGVDQDGPKIITKWFDPIDWIQMMAANIVGIFFEGRYVGWNGAFGFVFDFANDRYVRLTAIATAVHLSRFDNILYIAKAVGDEFKLYQWANHPYNLKEYQWTSKLNQYTWPLNFGAGLLVLDTDAFNEIGNYIDRATDGDYVGAIGEDALDDLDVHGDDLAGLFPDYACDQDVVLTIYADGTAKTTKTVSEAIKIFRLADTQANRKIAFKLQGYVPVTRIVLATSIEELMI